MSWQPDNGTRIGVLRRGSEGSQVRWFDIDNSYVVHFFNAWNEGNRIEVRAPRWVSLKEIDAALQEKADWIVRKWVEAQDLQRRRLAQAIEWRDGEEFPYLGLPVKIRLGVAPIDPTRAHARYPVLLTSDTGQSDLYLGLPPLAQAAQVRAAAPDYVIVSGAGAFDNLIATLQRTLGLTVFMVTHDLDSLHTVCDRIAVLADGKVIEAGKEFKVLARNELGETVMSSPAIVPAMTNEISLKRCTG